MTGHDVVFIFVALVTAAAGVLTVTSTNVVHAALHLAMTLAGTAGVFLVLHADFLALVQLVVYVGAIAVLLLFGLMLTRAPIGREALDSQNRVLGLAVGGSLFVVLAVLIIGAFGGESVIEVTGPGIGDIGIQFFASWILPFELLGVLLLGSLVGAVVLARREAGESGEEQEPTYVELGHDPDAPDRPSSDLAVDEDAPAEVGGAR